MPKVKYIVDKSKTTGLEKNKQVLTALSTVYYEKTFDSSLTNDDRAQQTYDKLIKMDDINNLQSPINKNKTGLGLILGNTFTDSGKAAYIFTDTPDISTIPNDVVYAVLKDNDVVSNIGDATLEKAPITLDSRYSTAYLSTAYIGKDGNLYTWGYNNCGELGLGDTTQRNSPQKIVLPNNAKPIEVGVGSSFTVVLDSNNNIYTCGTTGGGRLGNGINSWYSIFNFNKITLPATFKPTSIEVGSAYVYAMSDNKEVYVWGYNDYGQLGLGDTTLRTTPTKLSLPNNVVPAAFYAGYDHTLMITVDGDVYTCGINADGRLGIGNTTNQKTFQKVTLPNSTKAVSAALGNVQTLVLCDDGNVYGCGSNSDYTLGNGTTTPSSTLTKVSMPDGVKATKIACGQTHAAMICDDGNLYVWGSNNLGELGTGDRLTRLKPYKLDIPNGEKAIFVTAHYSKSTTIVTELNNTYVCGYNTYGQLGLGNAYNSYGLSKINLP